MSRHYNKLAEESGPNIKSIVYFSSLTAKLLMFLTIRPIGLWYKCYVSIVYFSSLIAKLLMFLTIRPIGLWYKCCV